MSETALSAELQAWLAAYPLPPQVEDMDLNMREAAQAFNVSTNTVKDWLNDPVCPMPCVEAGTNGREYVLRLSWCWAWREHKQARERAKAEQLSRLQASLFNVRADDSNAALSPKQIRETAEAALSHARAQRERGRLAVMSDVFDLIERLLVIFRNGALGSADRLERELQLTPAQTRAVERVMEELLASMQLEISEDILGPGYEANLDMNPQLVNAL